jgi:peptide/nickel transport system permease protein
MMTARPDEHADPVAPVPDRGTSLPLNDGGMSEASSRTLARDAIRRLRRNKLAVVSLAWIAMIVLVAISADLWVPKVLGDPIAIDTTTVVQRTLQPPSLGHPFGRDELGRDIASRIIYGARVSLVVGVVATAISLILGLILGGVAAFYGGLWDSIVMRLADVFLAFPYILFAIALIAALGPGFLTVLVAIGVLGWPTIARVFRSSILSVKENEYVDAARALGAGDLRIMVRHIMPNAIAPIIVYSTMTIGGAILTEAAMSFLGVGMVPPTPAWGLMLSDARGYMYNAPHLMIFPGLAILTTVLAFVLLGDGLRDALDVKMKD